MPGAHFYTAASFVTEHRNQITAIATVLAALVLAEFVDRMLARRGSRVQETFGLSPVADTRLRLIRRLIFATIVVLGVGFALIQFPSVKRVATGVLASSAVLGLIVGFAARQTLANGVAGILLAITQPIRVDDLITFQGETGTVEDVRLTYTHVRLDDGRRLIIPNEQLAASSVINHTIVDPRVRVEVSIWLPVDADVAKAVTLLSEEPDATVAVAEMTWEGIRLNVATWAASAPERGAA